MENNAVAVSIWVKQWGVFGVAYFSLYNHSLPNSDPSWFIVTGILCPVEGNKKSPLLV